MDRRRAVLVGYLIAAALVVVTLAVFWQAHGFGLTYYDDPENVSMNVRVQQGLSLDNVRWALTTTYANFRMPLVWLSFMVDREIVGVLSARGIALGQDNAGVYHLTNVLLHIVNTLLIFVVFGRMTGHRWRSAFVAALFAIHPLHVEPVAWATSRKDVLSGMFWMLTMLAYLHYARGPGAARYLVLLGVFVLALMAKPMVVTLPLALLLIDYWPLGRLAPSVFSPQPPTGSVLRSPLSSLLEKLPLLALTAIASLFAYSAQEQGGALGPTETFPLGVRIPNAIVSYVAYVGQTLWPSRMIPFYPHPEKTLPEALVVACALGLLLVTYLVFRARRDKPYLLVGWLWFVVTLVPVIGLVQVGNHAKADRYTYIPLVGLFAMAAWGLPQLAGRWKRGTAALTVLACAAIVVLSLVAHRQASYWRDDFTLFEHTLRVSPGNPVAHNDLGIALLKQGKPRESIGHFKKALEAWPGYATAYNNIGVALEGLGRLEEATDYYRTAIRVAPHDTDPCVHSNLGRTLGKRGVFDEAIMEFGKALRISPEFPGTHNDLGHALELQGKAAEAERCFRREIRLVPDNGDAHYNLGRIYLRRGQIDQAIHHLTSAVRLSPALGDAHIQLANALAAGGRDRAALAHYRRAEKLMPKSAVAANSLAWALSTNTDPALRDGRAAVRLADKACRLTRRPDPSALDTLAAAYAEAGRFDEAVSTAARAAVLARSQGHSRLARQIAERQAFYAERRPYRE